MRTFCNVKLKVLGFRCVDYPEAGKRCFVQDLSVYVCECVYKCKIRGYRVARKVGVGQLEER